MYNKYYTFSHTRKSKYYSQCIHVLVVCISIYIHYSVTNPFLGNDWCSSVSRSNALMSTGLVSTRSAPLRRKWSMSCCIALPVTPTIRPRYPRLRIASVAEGPSMLGILGSVGGVSTENRK